MRDAAEIAVIGGTGAYQLEGLSELEEIQVNTPFGSPSSTIKIGNFQTNRIAFIARHGEEHTIPPSDINYRANIYALKSLGVKKIVSISACGSLRDDYAPGDIVIPNQLVDFTKDRKRTFFDTGLVVHVSMADPFCYTLSNQLYEAAIQTGANIHKGGSFITIEGPRFSTKAESNLFRSWGMSIIGMTTSPEAFLAREAEMCYAAFAHVTDYDVWHQNEESVTVEAITKILHHNKNLAQQTLSYLIPKLIDTECDCHSALQSGLTTTNQGISAEQKKKLGLLIDKYIS
jgi:5'-methylthioadenosine phosphorylase